MGIATQGRRFVEDLWLQVAPNMPVTPHERQLPCRVFVVSEVSPDVSITPDEMLLLCLLLAIERARLVRTRRRPPFPSLRAGIDCRSQDYCALPVQAAGTLGQRVRARERNGGVPKDGLDRVPGGSGGGTGLSEPGHPSNVLRCVSCHRSHCHYPFVVNQAVSSCANAAQERGAHFWSTHVLTDMVSVMLSLHVNP